MKRKLLLLALPTFAVLAIVGAACSKTNSNANNSNPVLNTTNEDLNTNTGATNANANTAVDTNTSTNTNTAASAQDVSITNMSFSPSTLTVPVGTTVTWTNNDSVTHNVTGTNGGPASANLSPGDVYSYTFTTVGSFPYRCTIHPTMIGTITVTP